jgi:hypothetical protein
VSASHLPKDLASLTGDEFIAALAGKDGHPNFLEALWRASDPALGQRVVRRMAESHDETLAGLLLDEVLAPRHQDASVASELAAGVVDNKPALTSAKVSELFERLDDPSPLPVYDQHRLQLEVWLLAQKGKRADDWALEVLLGDRSSTNSPVVLAQATTRRARKDIAGATCRKLVTRLEETPQHDVWQRAADFVIEVADGDADKERNRLLAALIEQMPVLGIGVPNEEFAALVGTHGAQVALRVCEDQGYPVTAFVISALEAVDHHGDEDAQRQVLGLLFGPANAIWVQGPQVFTQPWDDEAWEQTLRWLLDDGWAQDPLVDANLVNLAPASSVTTLIEIAVKFSDDPGSAFIIRAAEHVAASVAPSEPGAEPSELDRGIIPWPCAVDEEAAERLSALLRPALADGRIPALVAAYADELINATQLVWLVDRGEFHELLDQLEAGARRSEVAAVMVGVDLDAANAAIHSAQSDGFEVDLAEAAAEQLPGPAFAGFDAAWPLLGEDDKDTAVALLCTHANLGLLPNLELVVGDSIRKNADRRQSAVEAIGRIVPTGDPVPDCVVDLLESARAEHRRAAVEAIATIEPADVETVRKVRDLAAQPDVSGEAARDAIERLALSFVASLREADDMDSRSAYLTLIGATGEPKSVRVLIEFIGPEAEYDDTGLRRAAAASVMELASQAVGDVSVEDHEKLSMLIDGPDPEVDQAARGNLRAAVARISLGEDDALAILYELIGFEPTKSPDALLGDEKESLVRHLGLYAKEDARGEDGWPGVLMQLDLVAERLARAAYLAYGSSDTMKQDIRRGAQEPDLGKLIGALANSGKLQSAESPLGVLHGYRCTHTDYTHNGEKPDGPLMTTARQVFSDGAKILVGALQAV